LQAIELNHCTEAQLTAQIRGVCKVKTPPKIIAFIGGDTAYGSADLAGQTRESYSPNIKIIGVPSVGRVGLKHVLQAFASGADGVIFVESADSVFEEDMVREHVIRLKKELGKYRVKSLRLLSIATTLPEYHKILNIFETLNERIMKLGPVSEETRSKVREQLATL